MKKIFKTLAIVAVAALGFACQNEIDEQVNGNEGEKVTVEVVGSVADLTRSTFGAIDTANKTVPSTWSGNEQVGFSALASLDKTEENEGSVVAATNTVVAGGDTASFSVEFDAIDEGNTVFAVSPYNTGSWALGGFSGITTKYQEFYLTIPEEQTPLAKSVEESTHLMAAEATYEGGAMTMTFQHVAAYAKMNITNFGGNGVKEIAVTFPTYVAGQGLYYVYTGENKGKIMFPSKTENLAATVTINPENVSNVANGVWFTVAPVGTLEGAMTVVVTDNDDKTYTKTITLPNDKGNTIEFNKGQVSEFTVNMNGIEWDGKDEPATYVDAIDFSQQGYTDTQVLNSAEAGSFVVNFTNGGTATAWYDNGSAVRVYGEGTFTVSSETTIVKIVLTYGSSDKTNAITTNVGTFATNTWTGSANSVKFTIGGSTGHRRIAKIEVHYAEKPVVKEATTIELGTYENTVDVKEGTEAASNNFIEPNATVVDASGDPVEGAKPTYTSNNADVATVNAENGNVTFTGGTGSVTITISYAGDDKYKDCEVSYTISVSNSTEPTWTLVTDASSLKDGDQIIIAAKDYNYAISTTQNKNNRGQAAITKNGNTISTPSASVQIFTLKAGKNTGTWAFYTGSGYIYAASSSSNNLKTETTLSANSSWSVTISNGTANIKAQGSYTRNVMQYNQTSSLFACYGSASQKALVIYKLVE